MRKIKNQYDSEVDALYIEFKTLEPAPAENKELNEDVTADYGSDGELAGLEILNASIVLGEGLLNKNTLGVSPAPHAIKL